MIPLIFSGFFYLLKDKNELGNKENNWRDATDNNKWWRKLSKQFRVCIKGNKMSGRNNDAMILSQTPN